MIPGYSLLTCQITQKLKVIHDLGERAIISTGEMLILVNQ